MFNNKDKKQGPFSLFQTKQQYQSEPRTSIFGASTSRSNPQPQTIFPHSPFKQQAPKQTLQWPDPKPTFNLNLNQKKKNVESASPGLNKSFGALPSTQSIFPQPISQSTFPQPISQSTFPQPISQSTFPQHSNDANVANQKKMIEELIAELRKRDEKISVLEGNVKVLNETMAMCVKFINDYQSNRISQPHPVVMAANQPNIASFPTISTAATVNPRSYANMGRIVQQSQTEAIYEQGQYRAYIKVNQNFQNIQNLKIENEHGKVLFLEPVDISSIDMPMSKWISISNTNFEIQVPGLRNKNHEVYLSNFKGYLSIQEPAQIQEIFDTVQLARKNPKIEQIEFDSSNGMLYIKTK